MLVTFVQECHQDTFGRNIGVLAVSGEEVDHLGMIHASLGLLKHYDHALIKYLIMGEPTELKLVLKQKGMIKLKLKSHGKAAHSGYPQLGVDAIQPLIQFVNALYLIYPNNHSGDGVTMNVGVIRGGDAPNVVPNYAECVVMFRVIGSATEIVDHVCALAMKYNVKCEVITVNEPYDYMELSAAELNDVNVSVDPIVAYNTDTPYGHFFENALLFGAGSILDAHTPHEMIKLHDLYQLPTHLHSIITTLSHNSRLSSITAPLLTTRGQHTEL
uniref:Peptidase M20 dimerisation domain-containing protein n=1 Tax=Timspurckia oligopyrenoides TaxID=708627 RepID=A0A7S1EPW0_9RHOD|mmetsp:Transcript_1083/g.2041  ORF Transcript_1083/g.2041 Transcript_1083/m.2041 type:complete len:272 (+) Transcript_1083:1-816(+)